MQLPAVVRHTHQLKGIMCLNSNRVIGLNSNRVIGLVAARQTSLPAE